MRMRSDSRPRLRTEKFQPMYAGLNCKTVLMMEDQLFRCPKRARHAERIELPRRKFK